MSFQGFSAPGIVTDKTSKPAPHKAFRLSSFSRFLHIVKYGVYGQQEKKAQRCGVSRSVCTVCGVHVSFQQFSAVEI